MSRACGVVWCGVVRHTNLSLTHLPCLTTVTQNISSRRFSFQHSICNVLYCTILYCTVLYCTVLYCTILYCTVLYCTVLYCTVLFKIVQ